MAKGLNSLAGETIGALLFQVSRGSLGKGVGPPFGTRYLLRRTESSPTDSLAHLDTPPRPTVGAPGGFASGLRRTPRESGLGLVGGVSRLT